MNLISVSRICYCAPYDEIYHSSCEHYCTFADDDENGNVRTLLLKAEQIVRYWDWLTLAEQEHFEKWRNKNVDEVNPTEL